MAMWSFGSHDSSGMGLTNSPHASHMRTEPFILGQDHEGVQSSLSSTTCYDLMRNSSKVIIYFILYYVSNYSFLIIFNFFNVFDFR